MKGKNIPNIIRNIFGGFFIFIGITGILSGSLLAGIFVLLFGVSLFPNFYEKTKLNKVKYIQIILPIMLMIIFVITMPNETKETNSNINEPDANVGQDNKNIEITRLYFNELEIELDIKESKDIVLNINPENANIDNLQYCSSDEKIATLEKNIIESNENKITLKINPITEGNCEIFVKATDDIESNKVKVKIIDNERIEKEKKKAEEIAKKEEEEQAKKQSEEDAKKQTIKSESTTTSTKKQSSSQSTSTKQSSSSSSSQSNSNNSQGKTVYRTPFGKRYHYDPDCGGKNSYQITLSEASSGGLTPCQKCAK